MPLVDPGEPSGMGVDGHRYIFHYRTEGWQGPEPGHGAATRLALDSIRAVLIFTLESG